MARVLSIVLSAAVVLLGTFLVLTLLGYKFAIVVFFVLAMLGGGMVALIFVLTRKR